MFSRVNLSTGAMASGSRCAFADGNPSSTLVGPVGSLVGESLRNLARDLETLAAGVAAVVTCALAGVGSQTIDCAEVGSCSPGSLRRRASAPSLALSLA